MTKLQSWTMMGISAVVLAIGVLLATGALTSAQSPTPTPGATGGTFKSNEDPAHEAAESAEQEAQEDAGIRPGGGMHGGCAGGHGLIKTAAAEVLGLSTDDLRTQLQSGKSLAEVAQA